MVDRQIAVAISKTHRMFFEIDRGYIDLLRLIDLLLVIFYLSLKDRYY